ncbi:MAG: 5-formyltetrahydrofolate cyclo-ligase [Victivallales bacterium]|nr:5-formyltetrahydrofolate cyclo-ligase [Victivallales bacterium]
MTGNDKSQLRRAVLAIRQRLTAEFRRRADAAIRARLTELPELNAMDRIAAYVSDGTEPDLQDFLAAFARRGGTVFLPRSYRTQTGLGYEMAVYDADPDHLVPGAYGIMEPDRNCRTATAEETAALGWLVPGVAFDHTGQRLGRGKGFYDRLLQGGGLKLGVFYACQQLSCIPVEPHDRALDAVVTEDAVYRFNNQEDGEKRC